MALAVEQVLLFSHAVSAQDTELETRIHVRRPCDAFVFSCFWGAWIVFVLFKLCVCVCVCVCDIACG